MTRDRLLFAVRYLLPAAIVLAGVIALIVSPHSDTLEGAFGLIGAGIAVAQLNVFYRIGSSGERDRDAEVAARESFDLHGEWPEEEERPGSTSTLSSPDTWWAVARLRAPGGSEPGGRGDPVARRARSGWHAG